MIQVYRDKRREWRWRMKARNGRIVAESGEGFKRRASCLHSIAVMRMLALAYDLRIKS